VVTTTKTSPQYEQWTDSVSAAAMIAIDDIAQHSGTADWQLVVGYYNTYIQWGAAESSSQQLNNNKSSAVVHQILINASKWTTD